jgi:predicted NBD/HSP70 family sugar kinase
MSHLWGVDLGGTKVEVVVLEDGDPSRVAIRHRVPTEASRGYGPIVERIAEAVFEASQLASIPRPSRVGIGTPGSLDPVSGLLRNSNTVCLNGQPLHADMEAALGAEVVMANDANCFALAEALYGAGRGASVVFGIIMGTGIGGGVVVEGKALSGRHGIAGEWGHIAMVPDGPQCYCGKRGCLERMCSGPRLEEMYLALTGRSLSLKEIWDQGDEASRQVEDRLVQVAGEALGGVINTIDPDCVILGGGVGQTPVLYSRLPEELQKWVFHDTPSTPLLKPQLGDSAGVFGAAMLAMG